ncbi:hypothetical protein FOA52_002545 [Chlamydomonas sp. UWO 241]|nr:hypothetical protein FOA52_002545 [Chlamydomonas sp. UWO 241]
MAVVNVLGYVETLAPDTRDKLYESPWTCQAVLRSLHPLAKQYILRLMWIERPVAREDTDNWVKDKRSNEGAHRTAMAALEGLGLLRECAADGGKRGVQLHPMFQAQLRRALAEGGQVLHEPPPDALAAAPDMDALDTFAHGQWEGLQLYILTSTTPPPSLPPGVPVQPLDVHRLLDAAGLIAGGKGSSRSITDSGFQFLLRDNYRQLWTFLTEYIRDAEARSGAELASVVSFIMQLGFRRVGQPCRLGALAPTERAIAGHLMQLGLLMPFTVAGAVGGETYFCPTRLASSLCGGFKQATVSANADIAGGHIIVETNYRVYAYTSSPVQVAILELFTRNDCVLPNLFVGTLTRDSVLRAVGSGISADEVVSYLQTHAHPHIAGRTPVVPEVVMDQVRLWEAETMRVRYAPCFLYEQFETPQLFRNSCEFARNQGHLLWASDDDGMFAARESGHEQIRTYIKALKEAMQREAAEAAADEQL